MFCNTSVTQETVLIHRWIRAQKEGETLDGSKRRGRYEDVAVWWVQFAMVDTQRSLCTVLAFLIWNYFSVILNFLFDRRFNQIINCCRYFVNQTGKGLVTLLTGGTSYETPKRGQKKGVASNGTQATPEAVELARSCGVNVESLRVFCARIFQQAKSVTWGDEEDVQMCWKCLRYQG